MEKDRENNSSGGCSPKCDLDAPKTLSLDEVHGVPKVANLIDVDTDVNAITTEPLTPTNKPLHTNLKVTTSELQALNLGSTEPVSNSPTQREPLPTIDERETLQLVGDDASRESPSARENHDRAQCDRLQTELEKVKSEKSLLAQEVSDLKSRLRLSKEELEREVQKRVELEQRFTEEAKRTTDQIEELIAKSDSDDTKLNELKNRFELYSRETSSMIENFTTNRELLASQLIELRKENDFFLGQYLSKARDLQSADIDLPQTVEDLQFHCLTLNEKLILSTMAKERLEEAMMLASTNNTTPAPATNTPATPTTSAI